MPFGFLSTVEAEKRVTPSGLIIASGDLDELARQIQEAAKQTPGSGSRLAEFNSDALRALSGACRHCLADAFGIDQPGSVEPAKGSLGLVHSREEK